MAKFLRLQIRGIRSVGDEDHNVHKIEFLSPCTLISGPNGTGKTTTIEALNYITTGQLPTAKKQAFIHSTDTARKTRVDASVVLEFVDVKGRVCTAVRRLVSTVGAKNTAQSEEHTLAVKYPDGTVQTLSSKVIDFNKAILLHLGVPKAIFKYVIFCHQEDSTWPLGEPKALKTRFDEIFQLTKFVKAQERMKKLVNDYGKDLKALQIQKELCETHVKDKIVTRQSRDDCERKIKKGSDMISELKERKSEKLKKMEELKKAIYQLEDVLVGFKKNKVDRDNLVKQSELIRAEPYCGTEEELGAEIEELNQSEGHRDSAAKKAEIDRKIARNNQEKQGLTKSKTDVENRISSIKAKVIHRQALKSDLEKLSSALHSELELDEDCCLEFELESSINMILQKMTENTQKIVNESVNFQKNLRIHQESVTKAEVELKTLKAEKQKLEKEVEILTGKIKLGENATHGIKDVLKKEEALRRELEKLPEVDEKSLKNCKSRRETVQKELDSLKKQCSEAEKNAENEKELENLKKTTFISTKKLSAFEKRHEKDWLGLLEKEEKPDAPWTPILSKTSNSLKSEKTTAEYQLKNSQLEVQKHETMHQSYRKQEETLTSQELQMNEEIFELCQCEPEEVEKKLEETRKALKKLRKELAPISAKTDLYDSYIESTNSSGCCPLCDRDFKTKKEIADFSKRLQNMTLNFPAEQEELEKKLVKMEEEETKLVKGLGQAKTLEKVVNELKQVREKNKTTLQTLRQEKKALSEEEKRMESVNTRLKFADALQADVGVMDQLWEQIQENQQKIRRLESESRNPGAFSYSELREQSEEKEKEYRWIVQESEEIQKAGSERNRLQAKLNELGTHRVSLGEAAAQTGAFAEQLAKKKEDIKKCEKDIETKEENELPDAQFARDETAHQAKLKEAERSKAEMAVQLKKKEFEQKSYQFKGLLKSVQDGEKYEKELGEQEQNVRSLNERLEENQQRQRRFEEDLRSFASLNEKERVLKDQMVLMKIHRKIRHLEEQLANVDYKNHEEQIAAWKQEATLTQRELSSLGNEEIKIFTQKEAYEKQLEVAEAKLATKECQRVENSYRDAIIEVEIMKAAMEDLNKYRKCLDTSLIQFHTEKMAAVNVIIDELWRKVYNSTDITTIRIRSDASSESTAKRAAYDYNVMMVQESGAEVEMRGRCSAGQKMLASLLIRIALAEVFGGLCSMIALDEPTTNLDEWKVDGMAHVLNELIEARRGYDEEGNIRGREMQMVVITHDERLVNKLTIGCRPEYIYCLGKDEHGVSYLSKRMPDGRMVRVTASKRR